MRPKGNGRRPKIKIWVLECKLLLIWRQIFSLNFLLLFNENSYLKRYNLYAIHIKFLYQGQRHIQKSHRCIFKRWTFHKAVQVVESSSNSASCGEARAFAPIHSIGQSQDAIVLSSDDSEHIGNGSTGIRPCHWMLLVEWCRQAVGTLVVPGSPVVRTWKGF